MTPTLVRRILECCYKEGQVYPIRFGPLRGVRLRHDRSINFRCQLGLWELENLKLLGKLVDSGLLPRDACVADVGANLGLFSLWFARHLSPKARIFAFEPSPAVLDKLRDALALNAVPNVELVPAACADHTGQIEFFLGETHYASSVHSSWASGSGEAQKVSVPCTTLDDFFRERAILPDLVKMDIEGGGTLALPGCESLFQNRRLFLIETHTPDEDQTTARAVTAHDYRAYRVSSGCWATRPEARYPDPEGVWGTVLLCPAERYARATEVLGASRGRGGRGSSEVARLQPDRSAPGE